ncbi:MAG: GAF domain-containing protein, partial [Proteobacteria bacterium]|nr:GAF domain-containing protein [Pseudomonadota bacterium]
LQQVERALDERSLRLNELLSLVLETMHRALALRAVVFCLRDARGTLHGRFALGPVAARSFAIVPKAGNDLFSVLCTKGADLHVADTATVAARLPAWYRESVAAGAFLLLPLMVKGAPIGLVYADTAAAHSLPLGAEELTLLRALRDQLVVAFVRGA